MIDRNNSGSSIKKTALDAKSSNDSSTEGTVIAMTKKSKSNSSCSSDSGSTSGSFNDNEIAPPGYNFCQDSELNHRELPVDVPDSFVGTIKQAPRYPPLQPHMPSISTFKPTKHDSEPPPRPPSKPMALSNPFCVDQEAATNGINTNSKNMQPQPQTPITVSNKVYILFHLFCLSPCSINSRSPYCTNSHSNLCLF